VNQEVHQNLTDLLDMIFITKTALFLAAHYLQEQPRGFNIRSHIEVIAGPQMRMSFSKN